MRSILIPCSILALATAPVWAQGEERVPAGKAASKKEETSNADKVIDTAAEIAARAMAAMDAIDAPMAAPQIPRAAGSDSGSQSSTPDPARAGADRPKTSKGSWTEGKAAGPAVLPTNPASAGRGIDLMSRARLDMMLPNGRSHRGVHYPAYRKTEGKRPGETTVPEGTGGTTAQLESLLESDVVTRLDDDHIQFDRAKWVQFDEKPAADGAAPPSMTLEIERGVYDLKHEILMTNQPVKIENKQFIIEAGSMVHDRATGLTRFTRAKMSFFQDPEPADENPSGTPDAIPTAAPKEKTATEITPAKSAKK